MWNSNNTDDIKWITNYLNMNIDSNKIERIRNFALLWNIFEGAAFNKNAHMSKIKCFVKALSANIDIDKGRLTLILEHFIERYGDLNNPSMLFDELKFKKNDDTSLVLDVLSRKKESPVEILTSLLMITFRLRCNLFHGEKSIAGIEGQDTNFTMVNELLKTVLDIMKNSGFRVS